MSTVMDLKATTVPSFDIGISSSAVKLKNSSGDLHFRNKADTVFINIQANNITGNVLTIEEARINGNIIELNYDATGSGSDYKMTLARPLSGMTGGVTYTLPASPINGYFLTTDSSGNMTWAAVSSPSVTEKVSVDYGSFNFGTPSGSSSIFTLPANAIVLKVEIIVDTAFDGTASIDVSGSLSGILMGSAFSDLTDNQTKFVKEPIALAQLSPESITFNFNAGGSSVGSGRVLVHHVIPAP